MGLSLASPQVIECNLAGEHCYVYDALMPFCPMHEAFFDSPFGTLRAAGPATCTTTTTATRTVTHTTTRTMTLWTTTRGQSIECRRWERLLGLRWGRDSSGS